jgi:hypothetical protein
MGVNSDGRLPLFIRRFRHGSPRNQQWNLPTFVFHPTFPILIGPVIAKPLNPPADEAT